LILPEINRIEALVTKAAALLESKGKAAAFAEFGKPDSSGGTATLTFSDTTWKAMCS